MARSARPAETTCDFAGPYCQTYPAPDLGGIPGGFLDPGRLIGLLDPGYVPTSGAVSAVPVPAAASAADILAPSTGESLFGSLLENPYTYGASQVSDFEQLLTKPPAPPAPSLFQQLLEGPMQTAETFAAENLAALEEEGASFLAELELESEPVLAEVADLTSVGSETLLPFVLGPIALAAVPSMLVPPPPLTVTLPAPGSIEPGGFFDVGFHAGPPPTLQEAIGGPGHIPPPAPFEVLPSELTPVMFDANPLEGHGELTPFPGGAEPLSIAGLPESLPAAAVLPEPGFAPAADPFADLVAAVLPAGVTSTVAQALSDPLSLLQSGLDALTSAATSAFQFPLPQPGTTFQPQQQPGAKPKPLASKAPSQQDFDQQCNPRPNRCGNQQQQRQSKQSARTRYVCCNQGVSRRAHDSQPNQRPHRQRKQQRNRRQRV